MTKLLKCTGSKKSSFQPVKFMEMKMRLYKIPCSKMPHFLTGVFRTEVTVGSVLYVPLLKLIILSVENLRLAASQEYSHKSHKR